MNRRVPNIDQAKGKWVAIYCTCYSCCNFLYFLQTYKRQEIYVCSTLFVHQLSEVALAASMPKVDAISQGKWQQVLGQESGQVARKTVKKNATILELSSNVKGKKKIKIF
jgi:hypothetical protein